MSRQSEAGQAMPAVAALGAVLVVACIAVFGAGRVYAAHSRAQTAADLIALDTTRELGAHLGAMADADNHHIRAQWARRLRAHALRVAAANDVRLDGADLIDAGSWPPTTVRVQVSTQGPLGVILPATAQATVRAGQGILADGATGRPGGQYAGPFSHRQGKPMCPAVASAFDRLERSARQEGVSLVITSAFRSDQEQAVLFRNHPDPRWVARPGHSRHRDGTELDIANTPGAWEWLSTHARSGGFVQRYSWEPWHYGYAAGCGAEGPERSSRSRSDRADLPSWVPQHYRTTIRSAAGAGGIDPIVLAAVLRVESGFNPRAVSPAGAQGIAQFMPATARGVGLADPFDAPAAITAAAELLGAHLRHFGSLNLALAAYNAGPGAVARYNGVPPYPETRAYVAKILALVGDPASLGGSEVGVELTRVEDLFV